MGMGLTVLFMALLSPLLFSIIFLLFRFSSRFGYSLITLRAPILAIVVSAICTILVFLISSLFEGTALYWSSGIIILAMVVLWVVDSRYLHKLAKQRKVIVKKLSSNRQVVKIIARIALAAVIIPLTFSTVMILWTAVTNPIFDKLDHDKFSSLDTQMRGVYQNLKTASGGADEWKYRTGCYNTSQNWLSPPDYMCEAAVSVQKTIKSVDELNQIQKKYYPVINTDVNLKQSSTGLKPSFGFGDNFSVSLAYAEFVEKKTNIECTYEINLHQIEKNINYQANNDAPGSVISDGQGELRISLRCNESARNPWYQVVQDSSLLIPE